MPEKNKKVCNCYHGNWLEFAAFVLKELDYYITRQTAVLLQSCLAWWDGNEYSEESIFYFYLIPPTFAVCTQRFVFNKI